VDRTVQIPISRIERPNAYAGLRFHSVNLKVIDPLGVGTVQKTTPTNKVVAKYHTVTSGDTLGHLAIKYKTTVRKICELNKMKETDILKLGRKLRVQ
jgi:LysM repeat protein